MPTFITAQLSELQRRLNRLRRKAGYAAIGIGVSALRPRRVAAAATAGIAVLCVLSFAAGVAVG